MTKFSKIYITVSVAIIVLLLWLYLKQRDELKITHNQVDAVTDTLHRYITKDGKNAAYIKSIIADRKTLLELAKKDKDQTVYNILKKNKRTSDITRLRTVTLIDTVTKTDTLYATVNGKQVKLDSLHLVKEIDNKYYNARIEINKDSVELGLKVFNDFVISHHTKSNGLFKQRSIVVDVLNSNPYTTTSSLKSYQIPVKKSRAILPLILLSISGWLLYSLSK